MRAWRLITAMLLVLAGCVPPGAPRLPVVKTTSLPRIQPLLDGLIDEPPIWESRPALANAPVEADGIRRHRVVMGDTGIAIARAYGIPWSAIIATNDLREPFILRVGQKLVIPATTSITTEARAAAFRINIDDIATGGTPASAVTVSSLKASPARFGGQFRWPLAGTVVEGFGRVGTGRINHGIEIVGQPGANIRAAANGTVVFIGNGGSAGYGGLILVRHGGGWISVYGRAAQASVARGQRVSSGQTIGTIGDGARLHFELRENRIAVDPARHLPAR